MNPIKNRIKHIWYTLRDLALPKVEATKKDKSLVILKMDAIGDYILFRNFIEVIATSSKYKNYEITLVGNILWKQLAEELDKKWISHFIWINPRSFQKDFSYRKKCFKELQRIHYSILIHPTVSRDYYVAETVNTAIFAKKKIASASNLINISSWQKRLSDKMYTSLIFIPEEILFEFKQNTFFINSLLETNIFKDLIIKDINIFENAQTKNQYCILFVGGSVDFKKWSIQNWKRIIEYILSTFKEDIIIAGGPGDKDFSDLLMDSIGQNQRLINLCGKTTLYGLLELISAAKWMISNETSAPHMAAAMDIPVLVISNANHYGRFTPYPAEMNKKYQAVFPPVVKNIKDESDRIKRYSQGSNLLINSIEPAEVIASLKRLLSN